LSKKNLNDLIYANRIQADSNKKNPNDFILWKESKVGEPSYSSPWGLGRPGWHIECSAMSKKYLGEQIDIHAGGEDLIFPHHENEIAQSEACSGKTFANYWLHNGFINIENKKMSKSENNFFTIRDIAKKFSYMAIRFFILSAHYKCPINFTHESMKSAEKSFERINNCFININFFLEKKIKLDQIISDDELIILNKIDISMDKFKKNLCDDFNTPNAIANLFEIVKIININLSQKSSIKFIKKSKEKFIILCNVLGFKFNNKNNNNDDVIKDDIIKLIEKREIAKKNKEWELADSIRKELLDMNIKLEDTPNGPKIV
jgi:cysteinyl-tRNA synthetase